MKTITIHGEQVQANTINDLNDSQRQALADDLIHRMGCYGMSTEVEFILRQDEDNACLPFTLEADAVNWTYTGEVKIEGHYVDAYETMDADRCSELLEHYQYLKDKCDDLAEKCGQLADKADYNGEYHLQGKYENACIKFEEESNRYDVTTGNLGLMDFHQEPEVMEWVLCPELCHFLAKYGEVVLDGKYWGRQCSGQMFACDDVIQQIAFDIAFDIA